MTASSPTTCRKMILLTQAELDGELDAAEAIRAAAHRADCAECQAAYRLIQATRLALRTQLTRHKMPERARQELLTRLRKTAGLPALAARPSVAVQRYVPWWRTGLISGASAAIAAALVLSLTAPGQFDLGDTIVDAHVRALQPGHLLDLPSINQHNVMPWFDGKVDFAPPVKNLADQGFPLQGSRLDYIAGHSAAALVYLFNQHPIELFVWPNPDAADSEPVSEVRNGYNILRWNQKKMSLWAISDVNAPQLQEFVARWRSAP
jgi:anti-sigma factor RsiW